MLERLNVGDLFNETADFSSLSSDRGILFDDATHKAKIQVNEEGSSFTLQLLQIVTTFLDCDIIMDTFFDFQAEDTFDLRPPLMGFSYQRADYNYHLLVIWLRIYY